MLKRMSIIIVLVSMIFIVGCTSVNTEPSNGIKLKLTQATYEKKPILNDNYYQHTFALWLQFSGYTNADRVVVISYTPSRIVMQKELSISPEGKIQGRILAGRIANNHVEHYSRNGKVQVSHYFKENSMGVIFKLYKNDKSEIVRLENGELVYQ